MKYTQEFRHTVHFNLIHNLLCLTILFLSIVKKVAGENVKRY